MTELTITVPGTPVSANHYVKHTRSGRHYVVKEAKTFKNSVGLLLAGRSIRASEYSLEVWVFLGNKQRGDQNTRACNADCLKKAAVRPMIEFNEFWENYPRKVGKKIAERKWKRLKEDERGRALHGLELWKCSAQWARSSGEFIPYASTFLNQERWSWLLASLH